MKKIKTTMILVLFMNLLYAQNPLVKQWDYRFGGTDADYLYSLKQTSDGGYVLGGWSRSGIGGDKTQSNWDTICSGQCKNDYWIVKIDSIGNKQWDKRFGGISSDWFTCLQQTKDRGYILGGYSHSGISGDKTQANWDTNATGNTNDYWIVKIDSLGNKQWDKRFGGVNDDQLYSLQQTSDNGYILGGTSYSNVSGDKTQPSWGQDDYWIVKTDSLGNKQWDKRFGGINHDFFNSLVQTNDGGYILGGGSSSGISGDKTQPNWDTINPITDDFWIVKIDSLGNKQWDKRYGGTNNDNLYSLQQTTDGGYILGGLSRSGIGGDKSQITWGVDDYWIVKIDSLGNKLWDKDYGGTGIEWTFGSIVQTFDKGYLFAGESASDSSGNKTENNMTPIETWVVKTDCAGNIQWDRTLQISGKNELGFAIQTKDSCYAMANLNFGVIAGDKTQNSQGDDDYWIIKFCDSTYTIGTGCDTALSAHPISSQLKFSVYPNPINDELNIFVNQNGETEIILYDIASRKLLHQKFKNSVSLNTEQLAKGVYIYEVRNKDGSCKKGKVVKD